MPNKLKDIFSNDMFNINGKMRFESEEAYKNFLSALELVQNEGRVVPIEGVTSITTEAITQGGSYPLHDAINISDLVIGPSVESINLDIEVDEENQNVQLRRYQISSGMVLETDANAVVYFKILFPNNDTKRHTVQYKIQYKYSKSIKEIVQGFKIALALFNRFYCNEDITSNEDAIALANVKKQLKYLLDAFLRLLEVESRLDLEFDPKYLDNFTEENQQDAEELYLLLCKNKVIRLSSKLSDANSNATLLPRMNKNLVIGQSVKLTFLGTIQYKLFGHSIELHSSNLLSNAIIKEINKNGDNVQVYYGDVDSEPMYVSYRAFLSEDDARKEMSSIMEHEESYINAKTIQQHIGEYIK